MTHLNDSFLDVDVYESICFPLSFDFFYLICNLRYVIHVVYTMTVEHYICVTRCGRSCYNMPHIGLIWKTQQFEPYLKFTVKSKKMQIKCLKNNQIKKNRNSMAYLQIQLTITQQKLVRNRCAINQVKLTKLCKSEQLLQCSVNIDSQDKQEREKMFFVLVCVHHFKMRFNQIYCLISICNC